MHVTTLSPPHRNAPPGYSVTPVITHSTRIRMFRFSIDNTVEVDTNDAQLATANIGRDDSFAERLRMTDDYRDNETVFRAENENPHTLEEAVAYVQGIFFRAPDRVWLGTTGDAQEVTAEVTQRVQPPTT